jgi:hypothetical protein
MLSTNGDSEAQSRRSKNGYNFEKAVFDQISSEIGDNDKILLLKPKTQVYLPGSKRPQRFTCMQITTPYGEIIGDTDIVVYHTKRKLPLMLVSCKTSIRERLAQSMFHWMLYKNKFPDIKLFFVTQDKDEEFGTMTKPTKNRILAESQNVHCYSTNPKTECTGVVHPFEFLIIDIKRIAGIKQ